MKFDDEDIYNLDPITMKELLINCYRVITAGLVSEEKLKQGFAKFQNLLGNFFEDESDHEIELGDALEEFLIVIHKYQKEKTGMNFLNNDEELGSSASSDPIEVQSLGPIEYEICTVKEESNEEDHEEEKKDKENINSTPKGIASSLHGFKRKRFNSWDRSKILQKNEKNYKKQLSKSFKTQSRNEDSKDFKCKTNDQEIAYKGQFKNEFFEKFERWKTWSSEVKKKNQNFDSLDSDKIQKEDSNTLFTFEDKLKEFGIIDSEDKKKSQTEENIKKEKKSKNNLYSIIINKIDTEIKKNTKKNLNKKLKEKNFSNLKKKPKEKKLINYSDFDNQNMKTQQKKFLNPFSKKYSIRDKNSKRKNENSFNNDSELNSKIEKEKSKASISQKSGKTQKRKNSFGLNPEQSLSPKKKQSKESKSKDKNKMRVPINKNDPKISPHKKTLKKLIKYQDQSHFISKPPSLRLDNLRSKNPSKISPRVNIEKKSAKGYLKIKNKYLGSKKSATPGKYSRSINNSSLDKKISQKKSKSSPRSSQDKKKYSKYLNSPLSKSTQENFMLRTNRTSILKSKGRKLNLGPYDYHKTHNPISSNKKSRRKDPEFKNSKKLRFPQIKKRIKECNHLI